MRDAWSGRWAISSRIARRCRVGIPTTGMRSLPIWRSRGGHSGYSGVGLTIGGAENHASVLLCARDAPDRIALVVRHQQRAIGTAANLARMAAGVGHLNCWTRRHLGDWKHGAQADG